LSLGVLADEGDGCALGDGDADVVGEETHDCGVLDPGKGFQLVAAQVERDVEDIAVDVTAEDGEELRAGEVVVAGDFYIAAGRDDQARVVQERSVGFVEGEDSAKDDEEGGAGGDAARYAARYAAAQAEFESGFGAARRGFVVIEGGTPGAASGEVFGEVAAQLG
jgi:hypothetical protein